MKEREEITISTRHLKLRTVLFILALVIAVAAFVIGVTNLSRKDPGYHRIEAQGEEERRWNSAVDFEYYFEGSGAVIRAQMKELQGLYGEALAWAEKLLDATERYPGVANLAAINECMGQDVTVSGELFNLLTDALARTQENQGYSLFAGPLYAEWNSLLLLEDPEDFDPAVDMEEARRLEQLAAAVRDPENYRFQIVDETAHVLRFGISEEYSRLLSDLELNCPVLDLNVLHDAYLLELIAARIEAHGYTDGYLTTPGGLTLTLSGRSEGDYRLLGLQEEKVMPAAKTPLQPATAYGALRAFALPEEPYWYYTVDAAGETLCRYPWFDDSGAMPQALRSVCVSAPFSAAEAVYQALRLLNCESAEAAAQFAGSLSIPAAYTPTGENCVLLNAPAAKQYQKEDYGWLLQPLN